MTYVSKFNPNVHLYVNKDDPEFDVAIHPSISAHRLRAFSQGIVDSLTAADEIAARTTTCEDNIEMLDNHTAGILCEIYNGPVSVPADAWYDNVTAQRLEAIIYNEHIRADTDVDLTIVDEQKGVYAIDALNPQRDENDTTGYVTLYTTGTVPNVTINFWLSVKEVREFVK